ncbi:MAG: hypothetical protein V3V44_05205 [Anaerolineales bacterium]
MRNDLTIALEDRLGTLAAMGELLASAGINIEGICGAQDGGQSVVHILVENSPAAREVLGAAGYQVLSVRDVFVMNIEDRPGALGEVARKLADAEVNIELCYLATETRLVLGVDDMEKAVLTL